jgi:dUTPase
MIKLDIKEEDKIHYRTKDIGQSFELKITSFKKLFKGTIEVPLDEKLQSSIRDGYLTLRGFERVLVGTGVSIKLEDDYSVFIEGTSANELKKGLFVSPGHITSSYKGEIGVIITNNTPFLNRVDIGSIIANMRLINPIQVDWISEDIGGS